MRCTSFTKRAISNIAWGDSSSATTAQSATLFPHATGVFRCGECSQNSFCLAPARPPPPYVAGA
ncbi:MAG: hypothetical protein WEE64_00160 [Dehalococcoidia bacterium]